MREIFLADVLEGRLSLLEPHGPSVATRHMLKKVISVISGWVGDAVVVMSHEYSVAVVALICVNCNCCMCDIRQWLYV